MTKKPLICECGKEIEITVPMFELDDDEYVCINCFEKAKEKQFLEENWHIIKKHYPEIELKLWNKYPQEKPKEYIRQCIVMTEDNEIRTGVFWSPKDSQHDDSIWQKTTHYINVEDLGKLLDIIKERQ